MSVLLLLFDVLLRTTGLVCKPSVFSRRWDEWLDLDRLMKHTEENMRKKHDLDEKLGNDKNAKVPRGSLAKSKPTNGQIFLFCTFNYFNPNDHILW